MVKTLVTSSLESTWPKSGKIIFLGKWCCLFDRKDKWSKLDYQISNFHWDDRNKFQSDFIKLETTYEEFLNELHPYLNKLHKKKYSKRFWRILIGPWLYTSINIIYDRWFMLQKVISEEGELNKSIYKDYKTALVSSDMDDFNSKIETDQWNEALYCLIINKIYKSNFCINFLDCKKEMLPKESELEENFLLKFLKKISNKLANIFSKDSDVFMISSHLSFYKQFLLSLKLNQFPAFRFKDENKLKINKELSERDLVLPFSLGNTDEFNLVLNKTLMHLIPQSYLESFEILLKKTQAQGWPENPKSIFTSNAYNSDDKFKLWAGLKVERGSKLVIGQHGGNFGMTPMAIHESHQIEIADSWLSWGWKNPEKKNINPVGNFKSSFKEAKHSPGGSILLAGMTLPRYSYYLYCVPIAGQVEAYLNDQIKFAKCLPNEMLKYLKVRLYTLDRGWNQRNRWESNFPRHISFDNNKKKLINSFKNCRVFIGTYNATTYIEAFSANMPTILFWNPNHWELNNLTKSLFQNLENEKIFHSTPESAAEHLIKIWDDVDSWWFSRNVQRSVKDFKKTFSKQNPHVLNSIKSCLTS